MNPLKGLYDNPIFKRETPATDAASVIRWWENRRIYFNMVVGCTGIVTCIFLIVCAFVSEPIVGEAIGMPDPPLFGILGIIFYAILANAFYTVGWIGELALRVYAGTERSSKFGLLAFRVGVTFSVILTISPAILSWIAFGIALHNGQTHGPIPE